MTEFLLFLILLGVILIDSKLATIGNWLMEKEKPQEKANENGDVQGKE